jgi:hypothetical protein
MTLHLVSQFNSARRNADNRAVSASSSDPSDREARLDRLEQRLAERKAALNRREKVLEQKEQQHLTPSAPPAPTLLRDRRPAGDAATLAQQIIAAGQKRRGELDDQSSIPKGLAGEILRAGQKRRGEIEDPKPCTEAEVVAAQIIEAGRRRRGEI